MIIGVMGGNEQRELASAIGAEITRKKHVVLTGGVPLKNSNETTQRTPWGALDYAQKHPRSIARIIGITKDNSGVRNPVVWDYTESNDCQHLVIDTKLLGYERNVLNACIPAVLIALRGKQGTLSEIAFGRLLGKPIIFADSVECLRSRKTERALELDDALNTAYRIYPNIMGKSLDPCSVKQGLDSCLSYAQDVDISDSASLAECTVEAAIRAITSSGIPPLIHFPGIPHDPSSHESFQQHVANVLK